MHMKKTLAVFFIGMLSLVAAFTQENNSPLNAFSSAFDAYRRGEYKNAGVAFMHISQEWPEDTLASESLFMASQAYINAGDYPTAYSLCEEYLQKYPQNPNAPDVEYQRGRIMFKTGNFSSAVSIFDLFLQKYPDSTLFSSALFWKAESYYQMGDFSNSLPLFNEVIASWPDSEKASLAQWRLYVMGLEAREAKLIRLAAYENQTQNALDVYQFTKDAIKESQFLKEYNAYKRFRQIAQTPSISQADADLIANNQRLGVLLEAKQKALNLLISRIEDYLKGLSQ